MQDIQWDDVSGTNETDHWTRSLGPKGVVDTLAWLAPKDRRYFIILDGLENYDEEELHDVFACLRSLMESHTILVCISCRPESPFHR